MRPAGEREGNRAGGLFERLLGYANDVELLADHVDPSSSLSRWRDDGG